MAIKGDLAFRWPVKMMSDPYKRINQEELFGTLLKAQMQEDQASHDGKKTSSTPKQKEEKNS
jgi:hypothetical protein